MGGEDNSAATCAWPGVHVGRGRAAGICHRICPLQRRHSQGTTYQHSTMDFSSITGKKGASSSEQKDALKQRVSTEIAMANAQQLISKATDKCYCKCVTWPGQSLSGKEQTCVERCLERYFEAFNIVSATYVRRVAAERASGALTTDA